MLKVKVNNIDLEVEEGLSVLQACEQAGAEIPRFCYHEKLSIAGNCRMCLVEIEKSPKPVASCAMPVLEGMSIKTNTSLVEKARKGVMEFLLANHPLDCPVCDQGGECDLQDQSMFYGVDKSRYKENKRKVSEKYMGPLIKTQMTRCIHCTRCIRFATEVAGVIEIGATGRGEDMQITTYLEKSMESELSANVIDLCPVGALTSKPYVFESRPWELKKTETIDVMDAVGSNIRVDTYGWEVKRILPRINEDINDEWISDKTRYACDGIKNQRLDTPYIKTQGKFKETSWDFALNNIAEKIKESLPEKIAGITGDLTNMETLYIVKEFFQKTIKSKNLESRTDDFYVNNEDRQNYIFNSTINGIEESDLIILVGTNPRYEATILNSRIRKSFVKNKTEIYSFGDIGDLTYPYKILDNKTETIKDIIENKNKLSNKIKNTKKPIVIIGQSALKLKSGKFIFEKFKEFLMQNNKINNEWNSLNVLSKDASTVGAYDLDILSLNDENNSILKRIKNNQFDILFLIGQDNLNFKKKNEFIIYIGTHGDKGAEIADVILPGATYTEQDGYFTNLEGKIQKAYKSSYPPGKAKEDWKIVNDLSTLIKRKKIYQSKEELIDSMMNYMKLNKKNKNNKITETEFLSEKILIDPIDYYYSNVIARSSNTMSKCRSEKLKIKSTGTDG
ncbi:MAG TPA: NADH-quinone oxidoreductase subunit NuoG [Candidatus Pelagibacter bacterium]|jgi:NADH-quinone oxidoreductase subunit G|nr:NADH-quinone oxidoreductase subunit NuoG [Candidatus Pelagibacter bacterium]|tara:strand:+ start:4734 stop:6764 length:2031 start_codon:yes stop_codon:yes gene_type:complete